MFSVSHFHEWSLTKTITVHVLLTISCSRLKVCEEMIGDYFFVVVTVTLAAVSVRLTVRQSLSWKGSIIVWIHTFQSNFRHISAPASSSVGLLLTSCVKGMSAEVRCDSFESVLDVKTFGVLESISTSEVVFDGHKVSYLKFRRRTTHLHLFLSQGR